MPPLTKSYTLNLSKSGPKPEVKVIKGQSNGTPSLTFIRKTQNEDFKDFTSINITNGVSHRHS